MSRSLDADALAGALDRALPGPVVVDGVRRVSGGASRETWLFDAVDADGASHPLVLRRDPGAYAGQTDRSTEFALLHAAHRHGVAVPAVVTMLEPHDGLGSGFVMARVDGETIARKILRDDEYAPARATLTAACGEQLARIHAVPTADLPPLPVQDAAAQLDLWQGYLDVFGEPHPVFDLALRWMRAHVPPSPAAPVLVHGDFRNGNLVVGPEGLRAVLDWELAHLGDPIEDLGWLCVRAWRFGQTHAVVGGFGAIETLLDAYTTAGGRRPSLDELRFWVALGTLKWGVMCLVQSFTHLNGVVRSVELATIGRRVVENEWDLLVLLDGGW